MTEPRTVDTIAASSDQIEAQLDQVETRLVNEYGSIDEDTVRRHVRAERTQYADAKVQVFVPILVERAVRDRLAGAH
ncbi:MAG TPA: hypothetical protein VGJ95_21240 [Pseudonocardiaceae bacterium]|jgi:hypothetical protein